jgi:hypothetical protein
MCREENTPEKRNFIHGGGIKGYSNSSLTNIGSTP